MVSKLTVRVILRVHRKLFVENANICPHMMANEHLYAFLAIASKRSTKLKFESPVLKVRAVIKRRGPGIVPDYYELGSRLLFMGK